MMSEDQTTVAPVDDTRHGSTEQNEQPANSAHPKVGGSTGTGIAAPETGYAESGQLPDDAAPPINKRD